MPDDAGQSQQGETNGRDDTPVFVSPAIPAAVVPPETRLLRFSFRHLDAVHEKFLLSRCPAELFMALLERIRDYSSWTVDDFCEQNNHEHRHVIDFTDTTEPDGFSNVEFEQLAYHESWQFHISVKQEWRVHGILIDDTFYIVWLDVGHQLYS